MYKIEKKDFGFKLIFSDFIKIDEMSKWVEESKVALSGSIRKFGVLIDMRNLKPLPKDSQETMETGQKLYKEKGMQRSAVILDNALVAMQFKRLAKGSGIYEWERYIVASEHSDWEDIAINWLKNSVDPDKS
ncbi:MAG: hypothetical protein KAR38_04290 [Calditrichia bacterium]|nr:hypothetical protein [Calditrichia bacterium]